MLSAILILFWLYQRRRKQLGENSQKLRCNTSVSQYFTRLLCVVTVCSCSSAEAELEMEILFTPASFSSFVCLLINSVITGCPDTHLKSSFYFMGCGNKSFRLYIWGLKCQQLLQICGLLSHDNISQPITGHTCSWWICAARKPDPLCGLISGQGGCYQVWWDIPWIKHILVRSFYAAFYCKHEI